MAPHYTENHGGIKMKKGMILLLIICFAVFGAVQASAKKVTQKQLQQCMDRLKRESAKKGYPITDPMVLRYQCMQKLSK